VAHLAINAQPNVPENLNNPNVGSTLGTITIPQTVAENTWILATCQLTEFSTVPGQGNAQSSADLIINSYNDIKGVTQPVNGPEVHAVEITELTFQLTVLSASAQGMVTVFFGIEGAPPGVTTTQSTP
jgi:hypothetical protein